MTREEIGTRLDLAPEYGWKEAELRMNALLVAARARVTNAGSKIEARMARDELKTVERLSNDVGTFVEKERNCEQAGEYIARADECLRSGSLPAASVSMRHLRALPAGTLTQDLLIRIEELDAELAHAMRQAESVPKPTEPEQAAKPEAEPPPSTAMQESAQPPQEPAPAAEELPDEAALEAAGEEARKQQEEEAARMAAAQAAQAERIRAEAEMLRAARQKELHAQVTALLDLAQEHLEKEELQEANNALKGAMDLTKSLDDASDFAPALDMLQGLVRRMSVESTVRLLVEQALSEAVGAAATGRRQVAFEHLSAALNRPTSADEAAIWHECCENNACETAAAIAEAWLLEARKHISEGRRSEAPALIALAKETLGKLTQDHIPAELHSLLASVGHEYENPSLPLAQACACLTLAYSRGTQKRRLHVVTAQCITFGRKEPSDVLLHVLASKGADGTRINQVIGRRHFFIENIGTYAMVYDGARDTGGSISPSKNGTYVDSRKLNYPYSIIGNGEILQVTGATLGSEVAHWKLQQWTTRQLLGCGDAPAELKSASGQVAPVVSAIYMARQDEVPEDVLILWNAAKLDNIDKSLEGLWLVRSGKGILLWDGKSFSDLRSPDAKLKPLSLDKLAHQV